jgi:hypothetical protein
MTRLIVAAHPVRSAAALWLALAATAALILLLVAVTSPATSGTVPGPAPTTWPSHASRTGVRVPLESGWPTSGALP